MRVTVQVFGGLRRHVPDDERLLVMELTPGSTIGDIVNALNIDPLESWNASIDGSLADPSDPVSEGSVVVIIPPIAGGAPTAE